MSDERQGLPSASYLPQIALCSASWRMQRHLADTRSAAEKAWAESGDRIHRWLNDGSPALTPEELDVAERCLAERHELIVRAFGPELADDNTLIIKERRLWFPAQGDPRCSGQTDYTEMRGEVGLVIDYKTNRGDHDESDSNLQLRTLAVIARRNYPQLKRIFVALIQPLIGRPVLCEYREADLRAAERQLIAHLNLADRDDLPPVFGPRQCRFCKAKLVCQAVHAAWDDLAAMQRIGLGEDLGRVLDQAGVVKPAIKAAEEFARACLEKDASLVPGYRLKHSAGNRVVSDPQGLFATLTGAGLLDQNVFIQKCVSVGIGATEAALAEHNHIKLAEAKRTFQELAEPFVTLKPKAPSLEKCH